MILRKKLVGILAILLVIFMSFSVFGGWPCIFGTCNPTPAYLSPEPECGFFCQSVPNKVFKTASCNAGSEELNPAPYFGSSPISSCDMNIVKVGSGENPYDKVRDEDIAVKGKKIGLLPGDDDVPDECDELSTLKAPCEVSCLTEDYSDLKEGCAPPGDYYVVLKSDEGDFTYDFKSPKSDPGWRDRSCEGFATEKDNQGEYFYDENGDRIVKDGIDRIAVACKLDEFSPEEYPSRCAAVVDASKAIADYKGQVFLLGGPDGKKCCGNDEKIDDGMVYNDDKSLCTRDNEGVYRWLLASGEGVPFVNFLVSKGNKNKIYDAVSNSEKWFMCVPDFEAEDIGLEPSNKLVRGGHLSDITSNSYADFEAPEVGFAVKSIPGVDYSTNMFTGYATYTSCQEYCESVGKILVECDCDQDGHSIKFEHDCDDDPFDDFTQYGKGGIAKSMYAGAPDPCSSDIDYGCNGIDVCLSEPAQYSPNGEHLVSTFMCDKHDERGVFVQCCGASSDYCGDRNDAKSGRQRIAGSLSTTLKDFDNLVLGEVLPGIDIIKFNENSFDQVARFKLRDYALVQDSNGKLIENSIASFGDEYLFPIFINQASKKLSSDAEIHDFTQYDYLELFYKTKVNYLLKLRLGRGGNNSNMPSNYINILKEGEEINIKDYVVNSPGLDKWMHVAIPVDIIKQKVNNIDDLKEVTLLLFYLDKDEAVQASPQNVKDETSTDQTSYINIIDFDRISLKNSGVDSNYYCISNKYDLNGEDRIWITDLDMDQKDNNNRLYAGEYACAFTPSFGWTGTKCCGDDQTSNNNEYHADNVGGCWAGNVVSESIRLGNVKYEINNKEVTQLCTKHSCDYPVTNKGDNNEYQVTPLSSNIGMKYLIIRPGGSFVSSSSEGGLKTNEGESKIHVYDIPLQITYNNKKFYGCNADNLNVPSEISNLIEPANHCDISGEFFCSPPNYPITASEWSDEPIYTVRPRPGADEYGYVPASERNTSSSLPDDWGEIVDSIWTDKYGSHREIILGSNGKSVPGCCPPDFCFDGYTCVDSINNESLTGPGEGTYFANSRNSFTTEWAVRGSDEIDFDQYVCIFDSEIKKADWKQAYYKERWDNQSEWKNDRQNYANGYCLSNDQCWQGEMCVNDGYWEEDNICNAGSWISRTKLVAQKLAQIGSGGDFSLFCDNYSNTLNFYNYNTNSGLSLPEFLSRAPNGGPNNFCVLTKNNENIAIGVSLNKQDNDYDTTLDDFISILPSGYNCDDSKLNYDGDYHSCDDEFGRDTLWLNQVTGTIIYSRQGVLVNTGVGELFSNIIEHPILTTIRLVKKLFGAYHVDEDARELQLLEQVNDFRTVYLAQIGAGNDAKRVLGHKETLYDTGVLSILYEGFSADVCSKLSENPDYGGIKCFLLINESMKNPTPSYLVAALDPSNFNIWHDGTAKLRLHDLEMAERGDFSAGISLPKPSPGKSVSRYNVHSPFILNGNFINEENIQSYYWDLDSDENDNVIKGINYGRVKNFNSVDSAYQKGAEGYHNITLIAVGYGREYSYVSTQICVDDTDYPDFDVDDDGIPNGCDLDDDNDCVCDDDKAYANGKLGISDECVGGCTAGPDNCKLISNPVDSVTGKQETNPCITDDDKDGSPNDIDAFRNDPAASTDFDGDGRPDVWNSGKSSTDSNSNPKLVLDDDDDNDGLKDFPNGESSVGCNINPDCDQDGLIDGSNKTILSSNMNDYYRTWIDDDLNIAHYVEDDGDYVFLGERSYNTRPMNQDSDGDGIKDTNELFKLGSVFLRDGGINSDYITHPGKADTDEDGLWDGDEITGDEQDPRDSIDNFYHYKTDPTNKYHDNDGMPDGWEVKYSKFGDVKGLDPTDPDDACVDNTNSACDLDQDGLTNIREYTYCSEFGQTCNPLDSDTDDDGFLDGNDLNPVRQNGPNLVLGTLNPVNNAVVFYKNMDLGVGQQKIKLSIDKPGFCKIGQSDLDINTQMGVVAGTGEKSYETIVTLHSGENVYYINCWDKTGSENPMPNIIRLKITYDDLPISVLDATSGAISDLTPLVTVLTSREAQCKTKVFDKQQDINFNDVDLITMDIVGGSNDKTHTATFDFISLIQPKIQNCVNHVDNFYARLCVANVDLPDNYYNSDSIVSNNLKDLRNSVYLTKAFKQNGDCNALPISDDSEGSEDSEGLRRICNDIKAGGFDQVLDLCDSLEDSLDKKYCFAFANFAQALYLGASNDNYAANCAAAKVTTIGVNSAVNVIFDLTPVCMAAVNQNKNMCYYSYCNQHYAGYYYSVKCNDTINDALMDNTQYVPISFKSTTDLVGQFQ